MTNQFRVNEFEVALAWITIGLLCVICRAMYCVPAPTFVVLIAACCVLPEEANCVRLGTVEPDVHSKKAVIMLGYDPPTETAVIIPRVGDDNVYIV